MSTKIYDAYRVKRSVDFRELLNRMKSTAIETLAKDEDYLRMIHAYSVVRAKQVVDNGNATSKNKRMAAEVIEANAKDGLSYSSLLWIEECLKESQAKMEQDFMALDLDMSLWPDDEYWYIKFFVNWGMPQTMMDAIKEVCPELEDYHYQNQCDTPEGIPEDEYYARGQKWDELLKPNWNYRSMLQYQIFGPTDFVELVRKNWYQGKPDLYEHLAYKFERIPLKDETKAEEFVEKTSVERLNDLIDNKNTDENE